MSSTLTVCLPLLSIALYLYECHHDLYGPRVFMNKHWLYIEYTVAVIINACNKIVVHVLCKVAMKITCHIDVLLGKYGYGL